MEAQALASASVKVRRHLLPFLIVCYFISYLDRVNIGFAALTMNADLGIGPEAFGFIAGIFFAGYCLFEVPSNVVLAKVGARLWIARIMITWGLVSMSMALATGPISLGIARFLLGVAEAGFFPGIIYYLTRWVPAAERATTVSVFMVAVPVSAVIGAPLSGFILDAFAGVGGLKGWQWLFIIEAAPAIVLGIAALFILRDSPQEASWLTPQEASALARTIALEDAERQRVHGGLTLRQALTSPRILALSLVYFGIVCGLYSLTFWTPQIVKAFGLTNTQTGFVSAIPFLAGALVMRVLGPPLGQNGRACLARRAALLPGGGRVDRGYFRDRTHLCNGGSRRRGSGHFRRAADVLDAAHGAAFGRGRGGRHRAHKLGRQHRRLRRAVCRGVVEGAWADDRGRRRGHCQRHDPVGHRCHRRRTSRATRAVIYAPR